MTDIPPGWVALALAVIGAFGTGGYWAQKGKHKIDLIDQYQERYGEQEDRVEKLEARLDIQNQRIRDLEIREITYRNYMYELIKHIEEGAGPPPPRMPQNLYST